MRVSDFMTRKLLTASPDDGIRETYFRMRAAGVRRRWEWNSPSQV